jgi:ATP-binding cassette subfamily B protein
MSTHLTSLNTIAWPASRLGELMENLARRSKLVSHPVELPQPSSSALGSEEALTRWIEVAAGNIGLETEPVDTFYGDVEKLLRGGGPLILRLPGSIDKNQPSLIALVKGGRRRISILTPDLRKRRVKVDLIRSLLCFPYEESIVGDLDQLLMEAQVPSERLKAARKAILREQLAALRIDGGWMLRLPPKENLWRQFYHAGVYGPLAMVLGLYLIQQLLAIGAWIVIGRGVFQGHYDWGWLMAWIILLFAAIPVSVIVGDAQSELSMRVGVIFKQRLLLGTLNLEPEEIRHQGRGQFLGRVMESEAVEMLALNGGFIALLSVLELILAAIILANGAGGAFHAALLGIWMIVIAIIMFRYYRLAREWAVAYREMTNDLVEKMVGHRTRLAQEDPNRWHEEEDQYLDRYLKLSGSLDGIGIQLNALVVRGWLLVGMLGIIFPFITNSATPQELAISLGGVLFAAQALSKLAGGFQSMVGLVIAWEQVGPLFSSAARAKEVQSLDFFTHRGVEMSAHRLPNTINDKETSGEPLLMARDILFRYRPQGKPVIQDLDLLINEGDRFLLEGPSGSGKSTLAALLTGLRKPESGALLLDGIDRQIIGTDEWRRRVVMAPQFQENYVFSETFAFNLLMGRRWPPRPEDLEDAEAICRELGLDEVLEKMPSGFQQMLGESGWQLSHGERSRLFIARTLLQFADLIVLDESFGALDPENLNRSLRTVLNRAPTLLVIAHP